MTTTIDRKANALRVIADRWDDIHAQLTAGQGLTDDEATDALTNLSRGFAHDTLSVEDTHGLMIDLRDACHRLTLREMGFLQWEDIASHPYEDETLLSLLNGDIDNCLFPLLSGVSTAWACAECRRTLPSVHLWQRKAEDAGVYCEMHRGIYDGLALRQALVAQGGAR